MNTPSQNNQGKVIFFSNGCLVPTIFLHPRKNRINSVGDICVRTPKNKFFHHNHSNPISTKLICVAAWQK